MLGAVILANPGTITMSGEIDMACEEQLTQVRRAVDRLVATLATGAQDCPLDWVVDVRAVTFMDSTGLGFLAHTHRVVAEHGGSVTVVGPAPAVMRTLSIVHLDEVLTIADAPPGDQDG
jgi:anti-anti-sigma factor